MLFKKACPLTLQKLIENRKVFSENFFFIRFDTLLPQFFFLKNLPIFFLYVAVL